jgi:hypothetical protein
MRSKDWVNDLKENLSVFLDNFLSNFNLSKNSIATRSSCASNLTCSIVLALKSVVTHSWTNNPGSGLVGRGWTDISTLTTFTASFNFALFVLNGSLTFRLRHGLIRCFRVQLLRFSHGVWTLLRAFPICVISLVELNQSIWGKNKELTLEFPVFLFLLLSKNVYKGENRLKLYSWQIRQNSNALCTAYGWTLVESSSSMFEVEVVKLVWHAILIFKNEEARQEGGKNLSSSYSKLVS